MGTSRAQANKIPKQGENKPNPKHRGLLAQVGLRLSVLISRSSVRLCSLAGPLLSSAARRTSRREEDPEAMDPDVATLNGMSQLTDAYKWIGVKDWLRQAIEATMGEIQYFREVVLADVVGQE